ncbi:hypothetical protein GF412_02575 [Candidatus Micrarchaeota archaeon]|nr:hypothetical protein [Candidatus Micrarchaeota archaeon]MBD3417844.1 hypothetical protein [Candidatus Micrarchaeota archaeon]
MRWLPIILILALLFYGCVEERQVSITGYEQVEAITGTDLTGDSANDLRLYTYGAKEVNEEVGLYMRKTVTVYPVSYSANLIDYPQVTPTQLQSIKEYVGEFVEMKDAGEDACFAKLGVDSASCEDEGSCLEQCTSTTCSRVAKFNEECFAHELYLFSYNSQELDQLATEIGAIDSVSTQGEKDALAGKLANMLALSAKLEASLLFRGDALDACSAPTYDTSKLRAALSELGSYELEAGSYEYKVAILLDGGDEDEFIELYITDSPPIAMSVEQFSLDVLGNGRIYEKDPLKVGWEGVEVSAPHRLVYYDFVSQSEPDEETMSKWRYPKVKERNLTALKYINQIYENPLGQFIFGVSAGIFTIFLFMGYYSALGAAVSLWVVLLFLLLLLLETLYHIIRAFMDKKNIKQVLMDAFGAPMADWKIYTVVGAVLVIAAVLLNMFYTSPVESRAFEMESLIMNLGSDIMGAVVVVVFVIGAYTLFLVVEDLLKGAILGKDYYELKGATKEENLKALAELREIWQALRMRIEDLSKTGMVVTEEYAIIVSVPIERLEQMIASGKQGMAKQLINFNQERLETLDARLDEKVNVMNEKWPEWKEELGKALAGNESVPMNTLLFIPMQWREWAVEKYISENRTKGYVLENGVIVKREVKVDELLTKKLKDLLKKKSVKHAVLLSKDLEVYNSLHKGKKTVVDVLFLKLKSYVGALSKKMGGNEVRRFLVSGEKHAGVYLSHNSYDAFIIAEKAKIREVVEDWNAMVEKLS